MRTPAAMPGGADLMLSFDYTMELDFSGGMAQEHAFTLRCLPQQTVNQEISDLRISLEPQTPLFYGTDGFGTRYCYGVVHAAHSRFRVEAAGMAERFPDRHVRCTVAQQMLYRQFTPQTMPGAVLRQIAGQLKDIFLREGLGESQASSSGSVTWQQALRIRDLVYTTMTYVPGVTNPATSAEEAVENKKGVCQDYAHIMLTLCRMFRIPCRYTAGLLLGEGESHAWVEVCDRGQWRELDPTNPGATSSDRLIFSHGRDAADCEINRGIYLGPSAQLQKVTALLQKR